MKAHVQNFIALCALLCSACVPSVHPLYTHSDLAFDPGLIGIWTDSDSTETWDLSLEKENEYKLVHTDESGKEGEFEVRLVKVGEQMFLDVCPSRPDLSQNNFYRGHILSVHTFVKLTRSGSSYQISILEPKWLKSHLAKKPSALRHAVVDGEILITDSTTNLQTFILSNLTSAGAFAAPVSLRRKDGKR